MIVDVVAAALRIARALAGIDYDLFRIFRTAGRPAPASDLPAGVDSFTVSNESACVRMYALTSGDDILCSARLRWGEVYCNRRNYFDLSKSEAELVELETVPAARGRGLATDLLSRIAGDISRQGLTGLRARVWHSNRASAQAFRKAGWEESSMRADLRRRSWAHTIETRWE